MRRMGSAALTATGPVLNVLPLAVNIHPQESLPELAQRLANQLKKMRRHQRYDAEQRSGPHAAHKDNPGGVVQPSGETPQPQRHQRKRQIGALYRPRGLRKLAEGAAIGGDFQAQDVGGGGAPR